MAKGTLTVAAGSLTDGTDTVSDPAQAVITPQRNHHLRRPRRRGADQDRTVTVPPG